MIIFKHFSFPEETRVPGKCAGTKNDKDTNVPLCLERHIFNSPFSWVFHPAPPQNRHCRATKIGFCGTGRGGSRCHVYHEAKGQLSLGSRAGRRQRHCIGGRIDTRQQRRFSVPAAKCGRWRRQRDIFSYHAATFNVLETSCHAMGIE